MIVSFDRCVFINCPFDREYKPILEAILFCVIYLGFEPRIAFECSDSGRNRLDKITDMIKNSKFSIHDLSRCISSKKGEFFRLNMPFELGLDYGCREYADQKEKKKFLILEEKLHQVKKALSDLAGCDMETHNGEPDKAIGKVRDWLSNVADLPQSTDAGGRIYGIYTTGFQKWNYDDKIKRGYSLDDINDCPTSEILKAIKVWISESQGRIS